MRARQTRRQASSAGPLRTGRFAALAPRDSTPFPRMRVFRECGTRRPRAAHLRRLQVSNNRSRCNGATANAVAKPVPAPALCEAAHTHFSCRSDAPTGGLFTGRSTGRPCRCLTLRRSGPRNAGRQRDCPAEAAQRERFQYVEQTFVSVRTDRRSMPAPRSCETASSAANLPKHRSGEVRLTVSLPDRGALDQLAQTLARLLVAGQGGNGVTT